MPQRIYTERRKEEEGVGADALRVCVRAGKVKKEDGLPQVLFIPIFWRLKSKVRGACISGVSGGEMLTFWLGRGFAGGPKSTTKKESS